MRLVTACVLLAFSAVPALAQREPQIVIPGKRGVPVYINGVDASWSVVEGEFGLDRPGAMPARVIYRPFLASAPYPVPGYFPSDDKRPGYGRLEIIPPANHPLPPPAPSFREQWSSQSAAGPVTQYAPSTVPMAAVVPRRNRQRDLDQHRAGEVDRAAPDFSPSTQKSP